MNRKYINLNRKHLSIILCIIVILVFTLTIAYAALSAVLTINGSAEVVASNWDIHLENATVRNGSVVTTLPTITNGTTATFNVSLSKPGDYYEFNIHLVNDGTLDAMVESITKSNLTDEQSKYFNYYIGYESGESINTRQLLAANDYLVLRVRVEYRNDITAEDLPSTTQVINSSFSVNYVASRHNVVLNPCIELASYSLVVQFTKIGMGIGYATLEYIQKELDNKELFELDVCDIPSRFIAIGLCKNTVPNFSTKKLLEIINKKR